MPNGNGFHIHYWDEGTVIGEMPLAGVKGKTGIAQFAQWMIAHPPVSSQAAGDPEIWSTAWAAEIIPLAKEALTRIEIAEATRADEEEERGPRCSWPVSSDRNNTQFADHQALNQLAKGGLPFGRRAARGPEIDRRVILGR
jgi:hypothetical protein